MLPRLVAPRASRWQLGNRGVALNARRLGSQAIYCTFSLEKAFPLTMAVGGALGGCLLGSLPSAYHALPVPRDLAIKFKFGRLPEDWDELSQLSLYCKAIMAGCCACSAWLVASAPVCINNLQGEVSRAHGKTSQKLFSVARAGAKVGCRSFCALTLFTGMHAVAVLPGTCAVLATRHGVAVCELFAGWLAAACIFVVLPLTVVFMPVWCVGFTVASASCMTAGVLCGARFATSGLAAAAVVQGRTFVAKALRTSPLVTVLVTPLIGFRQIDAWGAKMQQQRLEDTKRILRDGVRGG